MDDTAAGRPRELSKSALVAVVWAWILLLTITHAGERSPYSYGWAMFDHPAARLSGAVVNPDALPLVAVTRHFHDGSPLDWSGAQNLRLPMHSFVTATLMGLTRSYLFAALATNVIFAWLLTLAAATLADRFAVPRLATLLSLLTVASLPLFVEYLGQPLHYIAGFSTAFLVVLALFALPQSELTGAAAGAAVAILALNYDPYVFLAAVVCWLLFANRLASRRQYLWFVAIAGVPVASWSLYLRLASDGTMTTHLRRWFIIPVLSGWVDFFVDPIDRILLPFVASHVGVHVALHQAMAMIHWPLLAICVWLLIRLRPDMRARRAVLIWLLPLFFLFEQVVAAAWDWELNPRRALPVVLAFAVAWCFSAARVWNERRWRIALAATFAMAAGLAFADTLLSNPVLAYLHTGQAIRHEPQDVMSIEGKKLEDFPALMHDGKIVWRDVGTARLDSTRAAAFLATQAVGLFLLVTLLWLCARAELLPRISPLVACGVWLLSLVRFF